MASLIIRKVYSIKAVTLDLYLEILFNNQTFIVIRTLYMSVEYVHHIYECGMIGGKKNIDILDFKTFIKLC
jgi:hypothetical protein